MAILVVAHDQVVFKIFFYTCRDEFIWGVLAFGGELSFDCFDVCVEGSYFLVKRFVHLIDLGFNKLLHFFHVVGEIANFNTTPSKFILDCFYSFVLDLQFSFLFTRLHLAFFDIHFKPLMLGCGCDLLFLEVTSVFFGLVFQHLYTVHHVGAGVDEALRNVNPFARVTSFTAIVVQEIISMWHLPVSKSWFFIGCRAPRSQKIPVNGTISIWWTMLLPRHRRTSLRRIRVRINSDWHFPFAPWCSRLATLIRAFLNGIEYACSLASRHIIRRIDSILSGTWRLIDICSSFSSLQHDFSLICRLVCIFIACFRARTNWYFRKHLIYLDLCKRLTFEVCVTYEADNQGQRLISTFKNIERVLNYNFIPNKKTF